ncbi:MAG: STAS domain-containing protein [Gloeomargarita sp. DG02_1_bins_92]
MNVVILKPTTEETYGDPPRILTLPITRLDSTQVGRFKQQYEAQVGGVPCHLGIDLSSVEFLDSAGLGALVACHKHVRGLGGTTGLIAPRHMILRLLEMTALDKVLPVYASAEDFTNNSGVSRP